MTMNVQHQEWLNHPVTKELKKMLDKHEQNISDAIANNAMDTNKSDNYVVRLAVQLKTTKTLKQLAYDTETFVTKSGQS